MTVIKMVPVPSSYLPIRTRTSSKCCEALPVASTGNYRNDGPMIEGANCPTSEAVATLSSVCDSSGSSRPSNRSPTAPLNPISP